MHIDRSTAESTLSVICREGNSHVNLLVMVALCNRADHYIFAL